MRHWKCRAGSGRSLGGRTIKRSRARTVGRSDGLALRDSANDSSMAVEHFVDRLPPGIREESAAATRSFRLVARPHVNVTLIGSFRSAVAGGRVAG